MIVLNIMIIEHCFILPALVVIGIDFLYTKFTVIVSNMKKKRYDVLDARKDLYDNDFDEFKRQIDDLHVSFFYRFKVSTKVIVV